jgi:hypothetical protein
VKRRIALILRAGRPHYRTSLTSLMRSLDRYHGHTDRLFRLYLAYDIGGTPSADEVSSLNIASEQAVARFEGVTYLTDRERRRLVDWVRQIVSVPEDALEVIFARTPYSFQLNSALIAAARDAMDAALLFDDDGYFWVPVEDIDGTRHWIHVDPVGAHLAALDAGATVSVGEIAGARSPIPEALGRMLPAEVLRRLGVFFEGASEVLGYNSFLSSGYRLWQDGSTVPMAVLPWKFEWVTPANMAISLRSGFPVFFNPDGARGEDAFFALALGEHDTIRRIASAVFHDPFQVFPQIALGSFPRSLRVRALTPEILLRFRSALFGWVAYTPLFLGLTRSPQDDDGIARVYEARRTMLQPIAADLASHLADPVYNELIPWFDSYCARVVVDRADWRRANQYWRNAILPAVLGRAVASGEGQNSASSAAASVLAGRDDDDHSVPRR